MVQQPTIVLCFLYNVEAQFQLFVSVCLLKHYFFRLLSRILFKSFQDLAFRGGGVILPVLIDNCVVFSVKVHALFVLNGELINLNTQTNTTFVNLGGVFISFILWDIILSSKVSVDRMALGLLSVDRSDLQFLIKLCKDQAVPQSLWDFHRKQG